MKRIVRFPEISDSLLETAYANVYKETYDEQAQQQRALGRHALHDHEEHPAVRSVADDDPTDGSDRLPDLRVQLLREDE